jgi:hypothetical protein
VSINSLNKNDNFVGHIGMLAVYVVNFGRHVVTCSSPEMNVVEGSEPSVGFFRTGLGIANHRDIT